MPLVPPVPPVPPVLLVLLVAPVPAAEPVPADLLAPEAAEPPEVPLPVDALTDVPVVAWVVEPVGVGVVGRGVEPPVEPPVDPLACAVDLTRRWVSAETFAWAVATARMVNRQACTWAGVGGVGVTEGAPDMVGLDVPVGRGVPVAPGRVATRYAACSASMAVVETGVGSSACATAAVAAGVAVSVGTVVAAEPVRVGAVVAVVDVPDGVLDVVEGDVVGAGVVPVGAGVGVPGGVIPIAPRTRRQARCWVATAWVTARVSAES